VRIDGTYRPDLTKLTEMPGEPATAGKSQAGPPQAAAPSAAKIDAQLQPYLDKVRENPDVDMEAVRSARKLLDEGQLDTPDAILRAAQAMVDLDF